MKKIIFSLFIFLLTGCAKYSYMYDQSTSYLGLLLKSKDNDEILKDKNITKEHKDKIREIIKYKDFFYKYFEEKQTGIYTQTTILDKPAVTYLVIASKYSEIKPVEFDFPFIGSFPYIGFFDQKKASLKEEELQSVGLVTYQRPVYAFSTLGYFEDRILSSFFYFENFGLSELIFHELFHTIFFIKNDVELNENLANYFGKELALEYFKDQPKVIEGNRKKIEQHRVLSQQMQKLTLALEAKYQSVANGSKEQHQEMLDVFLDQVLNPEIKKSCTKLKIEKADCYPLNIKWNNAKLAAFKSYEKSLDFFERLHKTTQLDLKTYYKLLKDEYSLYNQNESNKNSGDFTSFLQIKYPLTE